MSWMRSETYLSQFLRDFLPTLFFRKAAIHFAIHLALNNLLLVECSFLLTNYSLNRKRAAVPLQNCHRIVLGISVDPTSTFFGAVWFSNLKQSCIRNVSRVRHLSFSCLSSVSCRRKLNRSAPNESPSHCS